MQLDNKYILLMPCYKDGESASKIVSTFCNSKFANQFQYVVVNDCEEDLFLSTTAKVHIIQLQQNKGHQAAIAIGLAYCVDKLYFDHIIVMDADEQDSPEDVISLLEQETALEKDIVFFKRKKRNESFLFKFCYTLYLFIAKLLTGYTLRSGNFTSVNKNTALQIVHLPSLYNHYNATLQLLKNKTTYNKPSNRLPRKSGKSTMHFYSLINHGLNALSVMSKVVAVRLFFWSGVLFITSIIGLATVLILKFFSNYTIYGWTSTVSILLFIILLFSVVLSTIALLLHKSSNWNENEKPINTYNSFIKKIDYA